MKERDLIERASDLDDWLREEGDVEYLWVPRRKNRFADAACSKRMDEGSRGLLAKVRGEFRKSEVLVGKTFGWKRILDEGWEKPCYLYY